MHRDYLSEIDVSRMTRGDTYTKVFFVGWQGDLLNQFIGFWETLYNIKLMYC